MALNILINHYYNLIFFLIYILKPLFFFHKFNIFITINTLMKKMIPNQMILQQKIKIHIIQFSLNELLLLIYKLNILI